MKKSTFISLSIILITANLFAQKSSDMEKEKEAIRLAALDYMDGAHEGNAKRIVRSVHPELTKYSLRTLPKSDNPILYKAGFTRLLELVRANVIPLEKEKRNIEVTIFEIKEGLACAKVVSAMFYDYLHLAKIEGQWKLINVLWTWNPKWKRDSDKTDQKKDKKIDPEKEKKDIKQTALDYIEGSFSGDEERMAKAIHPELNKVIPAVIKKTGKTMLNYSGAEMLVEGTLAKLGILDKDKWNIQVNIFDIQKDIASVEVLSAMYYDYLQMAKIEGSWKIVNVLWKMNPNAPKRN